MIDWKLLCDTGAIWDVMSSNTVRVLYYKGSVWMLLPVNRDSVIARGTTTNN